jgi:hypothetical protein
LHTTGEDEKQNYWTKGDYFVFVRVPLDDLADTRKPDQFVSKKL